MALPSKNVRLNEIADFDVFRNGGKGSGNFGHLGRPGEVGGSASSGGGAGASTSDGGANKEGDANDKFAKGGSDISKSMKKLSSEDYVYDSGASVWKESDTHKTFKKMEREVKDLSDYMKSDRKEWKSDDLQRKFGMISYYTDTLIPYLESRAYYSKGSGVDKMYKRHLKEMQKIAKIAKDAEDGYYDKKVKALRFALK